MNVWICLASLAVSLGTTVLPLSLKASETKEVLPITGETVLLHSISKAMQDGDVPAMAELYRRSTAPVPRVLAAMALERIHFNLEKSTADARICERSLIDSHSNIAFYCARVANGNLRLSAGTKQAEADELDIVRRFTGRFPSSSSKSSDTLSPQGKVRRI